jgi:hypothetical protein
VEVHYDEGVANRIGPKPCAGACEGTGEASVGECIGQLWSRGAPGRPAGGRRCKSVTVKD